MVWQKLCFDFGIELDDVTSEKEMARREKVRAKSATTQHMHTTTTHTRPHVLDYFAG